MQKTQNYNLNKPEAGDPLRLADFNQNSDILDAALKNLSAERVITGSYTGDGASERIIDLPFTPKMVLLFVQYGNNAANKQMYVLTEPFQFYFSSSGSNGFTNNVNSGCALLENGLKVGGVSGNYKDMTNHYIAIQ